MIGRRIPLAAILGSALAMSPEPEPRRVRHRPVENHPKKKFRKRHGGHSSHRARLRRRRV